MIDLDFMESVVAEELETYLTIPVICTNQTGEPPPYPYLSYTITSLLSETGGTWGEYGDGKDRKPALQTWSITVQSDDSAEAVDYALKARDWLGHAGTVYLNDNGVIVQSVGGVTNRDSVIADAYEYRSGFDAVFWLMNETESVKESTGYIETVEMERV